MTRMRLTGLGLLIAAVLALAGSAQAASIYAIDGGPIGSLRGVETHSFGRGPVDPAAVAHGRLIARILRHAGHVVLLEALPAISYRARDRQVAAAIHFADARHAPLVNFSGGRPVYQPRTCRAIRRAPRTRFIVAAGVEGTTSWPAACHAPNMLVVGRAGANYGVSPDVRLSAPSTSEATARMTVRLARHSYLGSLR
jgi:hypothetical protein